MSARPALEAVVFDAGGTLVRLDYEWMAALLAGLGVATSPPALRRAEIAGRRAYDAGARDGRLAAAEVYWAGIVAAAGCPADVVPAAVAAMRRRQDSDAFLWARPMEGARAAIDGLARLGLALACVSNADGRAEEHLVRGGVREGLAFVIDSHVVGIEKPDPRIFALALDRLGVAAERALYVGDLRCVDEAGPRAAGMHHVVLDPFGDYADGAPAVATIADLPAWVAANFDVRALGRAR